MSSSSSLELRLRLPLLGFLFVLLAALFLPDRVWNTLLVGLGGLLAAAYFWARQMANGVRAGRRLRFGWMAVGDRLSEAFEIRNESALPALWVEVVDYSNVPGYRPAVVRSLGPNSVDRWRQSAVCERRGQFRLGPWAIRSGDPFGIFQTTRYYDQTEEIIIHPPIHTDLPVDLPLGQSSGRARTRERSWQATVNAASVRDYQPQDPYRWIHWPTSARQQSLYVRQFERDVSGDLWLLLDLEAAAQLGEGAAGSEEQIILLAASLAVQALQQNRAVGLAAYGSDPQLIPPARGQGQQWRLLRALALLRADGETGLAGALRDLQQTIRRGATALIITPTPRADWLSGLIPLQRQGVQSSVILLDRPSFGGEENSRGLRDGARRLGFTCHLLQQGEVGRPAQRPEQRGFWKFRVLATGKVVTLSRPDEDA